MRTRYSGMAARAWLGGTAAQARRGAWARRGACWSAVVLVVCALAGTAHADRDRRVAVVAQLLVNVDYAEATSLTGTVAEALGRALDVEVIGGEAVTSRLPGGVPDGCVDQPDCLTTLSSSLGSDELLFLVLVRVGDELQIDVTWVEVSTGTAKTGPRLSVPRGEDVAARVTAQAPALVPAARRVVPDRRDRVPAPDPIREEPSPSGRRFTAPVLTAAGVSVVAFAAAGVLGLQARSRFRDCDGVTPACDEATRDAIRQRALGADLALAVGAVALGTTVVLYLRSAPVRAAPTRGGVVVSVGTRF